MFSKDINRLNEIILKMYDTDISLHNRILHFLHDITDIIYYDRGTVQFFYQNSDGTWAKHSSISVNWDSQQSYVEQYDKYYCHIDDTLPILGNDNPIIFRCSTFFDLSEREKTEFYRDYLVPNNCIFSIECNLQIQSTRGLKSALYLYRGKEKRDFTEDEVEIVRLLQPHLSSILRYYGENIDIASILFMLENYNCVGSIMLDESFQTIRSNETYKSIITNEYYGKIIMNKVIELCISLTQSNNNMKNLSYEYKCKEIPFYIEITKIPHKTSDTFTYHYLGLVYNLSRFITATIDQAKEQFSLTEREFDILKLILKGKSIGDISSDLYLSSPTVKKYLSSIYSKMEIKNQKQIFGKLGLT